MSIIRSGHRMVVWRNYIVLFGGFYEALREVKWFNDSYLFSLMDNRWIELSYKMHTQVSQGQGQGLFTFLFLFLFFVFGIIFHNLLTYLLNYYFMY